MLTGNKMDSSNLATLVLLASLAIGVWTSRQRKIDEA